MGVPKRARPKPAHSLLVSCRSRRTSQRTGTFGVPSAARSFGTRAACLGSRPDGLRPRAARRSIAGGVVLLAGNEPDGGQAEPLDLGVERAPSDAERPRSRRPVAAVLPQRLGDAPGFRHGDPVAQGQHATVRAARIALEVFEP